MVDSWAMWLIALVVGIAFPGFGQALAGRWRLGLAVALLALTLYTLVVVSPWLLVAMTVVRLGIAVHGALLVRRRTDVPRWESAAAVAGACVVVMIAFRIYVVEFLTSSSSSMAPTLQVRDQLVVNKLDHSVARGDVIVFEYPCSPRVRYAKRVVAIGGDTVEVRCDVVYINGKAVPHDLIGPTEYLDRDEAHDGWYRKQARESREELGGHRYRVFDSPFAGGPDSSLRDFPLRDALPSCADSDDSTTGASPLASAGRIVGARADSPSCAPQMQYVVPAGSLFVLGDNRYNSNDSRVWGAVSEDAVIGTITGIWWPDSNNGSRIGRIE